MPIPVIRSGISSVLMMGLIILANNVSAIMPITWALVRFLGLGSSVIACTRTHRPRIVL